MSGWKSDTTEIRDSLARYLHGMTSKRHQENRILSTFEVNKKRIGNLLKKTKRRVHSTYEFRKGLYRCNNQKMLLQRLRRNISELNTKEVVGKKHNNLNEQVKKYWSRNYRAAFHGTKGQSCSPLHAFLMTFVENESSSMKFSHDIAFAADDLGICDEGLVFANSTLRYWGQ